MKKLEKIDSSKIIKLDSNVVFQYNDFSDIQISSEMINYLDKLVENLKQKSKINILIKAHTDRNGKDENDRRAKADFRANSIRNYLIKKGIGRNRIFWEGIGNCAPIYNNNKDNRIEIIFIK